MARSRSNIREIVENIDENDAYNTPVYNKLSPNRVREIEKILGFSLSSPQNGVQNNETESHFEVADQAIQLVRAFNLITNAEVRADILAMVIAAAQHESDPD